MENNIRFIAGNIYENENGIYDEDRPRYKYLQPEMDDNGQYYAVDCWIVDKNGNIHPGYDCSPVPIICDNIGGPIS